MEVAWAAEIGMVDDGVIGGASAAVEVVGDNRGDAFVIAARINLSYPLA